MQNPGTVPQDVWICCQCNGGNLIALTDGRCPVCGHQRSSCCIGPGEPYPKTMGLAPTGYCSPSGISIAYHGESYTNCPQAPRNDLWYCSECGSENCDWYDVCPICNRGTKSSSFSFGSNDIPTVTYGGAGSPAEGSWICSNCGASNSNLTPEFCPICGCGRG